MRGPIGRHRRGGSTSSSSSTSMPALLASTPRPPFSGIAKRGSEHGGPARSPDATATRLLAATARPPACGGEAPQPACGRGARPAACPSESARLDARARRGLAAARPDRSCRDDPPLPHRILPRRRLTDGSGDALRFGREWVSSDDAGRHTLIFEINSWPAAPHSASDFWLQSWMNRWFAGNEELLTQASGGGPMYDAVHGGSAWCESAVGAGGVDNGSGVARSRLSSIALQKDGVAANEELAMQATNTFDAVLCMSTCLLLRDDIYDGWKDSSPFGVRGQWWLRHRTLACDVHDFLGLRRWRSVILM
ncbi:uncharacterized protein [Miscanthus floridulus]|uniref:uncharacterized protein isoform X2 n=1 Tax=Miscanthus floridulus TaxID=154761 RepID=UPI0034587DDA